MVDLIPAEYRRSLRIQHLVRGSGWAALGLAAALGAAGAGLAYTIGGERAAITRLKHTQTQARAQQARLTELSARRDEAGKQLHALDSLRGGAVIGPFADALETALTDGIWFQEMAFSREPERKTEAATPAPGAAAVKADDTAVRIEQRAEIRGVARDHAALAQFIERLGVRPGITHVRLVDTSARSYPGVQVVDFRLALTLGGAAGATQ